MATRTYLRRAALPLACAALLTVGTQPGRPEPQPPPLPAVPEIPTIDRSKIADNPPILAPKPIATPPAAPSVDELIGQLEKLRQQKVELERQEKAVAEKLQERLRDQAGRLAKLGIVPPSKEEAKDVADGIMPLLQK